MKNFSLAGYSPSHNLVILTCEGPMPTLVIGAPWIARPASDVEDICWWAEDNDGNWSTCCGTMYSITHPIGIKGCGYNYCPNCGRPINIK